MAKHRKTKQGLSERAQTYLSLLSGSLLSADELVKLTEHVIELIRLIGH